MSSSEDDVALECANKVQVLEFIANQISKHPEILSKSQTPALKKKKEDAIKQILQLYQNVMGQLITSGQLMKKINNMKARLKKKTDVKKTGNKPIKLLPWEKVLYEAMDGDSNPTVAKIAGAKSYGTSLDVLSPITSFGDTVTASCSSATNMALSNTDVDQCEKTSTAATPLPLPPRQKRSSTALPGETEETQKLSNLELQRLVLLEQIQTTRVQRNYYENKIKKDAVQIVYNDGKTYKWPNTVFKKTELVNGNPLRIRPDEDSAWLINLKETEKGIVKILLDNNPKIKEIVSKQKPNPGHITYVLEQNIIQEEGEGRKTEGKYHFLVSTGEPE
ncbi:unnamed protein product [Brassicogethes aeneus]|uniref:Uncharacterized protein n=1 Tax=Brassicogethes aeneus TaxID=1431903 RepID=A0A9P0FPA7_BRAAE|nr:unnamed protein product [Brassicogethes aeneus]